MSAPEHGTESDAIFWDVLRERDAYRDACHAAAGLIERQPGKVIDASGNVTAIVLPVESWRSIRAMLQAEPGDTASASTQADAGDPS